MWVARIRFSGEGTLIGSKTPKHHVDFFALPLSYNYEKDHILVHAAGTLLGKEEDKKNFVKELKKEPRTVNFELAGDFFIATIKEPLFTKDIYNKDIIHLAPALISEKGYEVITIGSFKREPLQKTLNIFKKLREGKLLSIQKRNIRSISVMKFHPDLTDKQKQAMELALKNGYYHSPRKIDLPTLAKMAKISYSTFQVHLRKAEAKLIPYFFE